MPICAAATSQISWKSFGVTNTPRKCNDRSLVRDSHCEREFAQSPFSNVRCSTKEESRSSFMIGVQVSMCASSCLTVILLKSNFWATSRKDDETDDRTLRLSDSSENRPIMDSIISVGREICNVCQFDGDGRRDDNCQCNMGALPFRGGRFRSVNLRVLTLGSERREGPSGDPL